jgi:steroid 5-alpha reductase family enzyme
MEKENRNSLIALPVVILIAVGLAWAGSQGSSSVLGMPIFALGVALAFLIQWLGFLAAYALQTETFYDLTGSVTYISITVLSVLLSRTIDDRSALLMTTVLVWATRLGTFLFGRIMKSGKDERFDEIKVSFLRFLLTWTVQGLWVSFTAAAAWVAITTTTRRPLGWPALIGFLVWAFGFGFEVLADTQKSAFKADPENKGQFIDTGLWSWSRHPNYFGEIVLWVGVAIIALPVLRGWQWVALISPLYVTAQLTLVSGIPILEKKADERWGGQEDYEAYKERTPVLIPRPPGDRGS